MVDDGQVGPWMQTVIVDSPPDHSMNEIDDFEGTGPRAKGVFAMFEGGYLMERPRYPSSIRQAIVSWRFKSLLSFEGIVRLLVVLS
jgi:hypothetical protein